MYYVMRASAPSLHRESTDSLIIQKYVHGFDRQTKVSSGIDSAMIHNNYYDKGSSDHELHSYVSQV